MPVQWLCACACLACVLFARGPLFVGWKRILWLEVPAGLGDAKATLRTGQLGKRTTDLLKAACQHCIAVTSQSIPFAGTAGSVVWRFTERKEAF